MSELDEAIRKELTEEDKEFLSRFDTEPGSIAQMFGVFSGPLAWLYVSFVVAAVVLGPFGLYAAWQFFNATDTRALFYWGFGLTAILIVLSVVRIVFFQQLNTNRLLREMKRLELQVARLSVQADRRS